MNYLEEARNNMKNNIRQKIDLAILQEKVNKLEASVDDILNNHLPHLHEKLDSIEKKMAYWSGGLAVLIVIVNLLIRR